VSPTGKYYSPSWSPDGRTVALRRREGTETASSLTLMTLDGPDEVPLFVDESPSLGLTKVTRLDAPTWAPDGQSLAFASLHDSNTWAIWLISRSGGQLRRLLPDLEQPHFSPSWARQDPNRLVMVAESDGVQDLWLVDVSKSAATENLTRDLAAQLRNPRSPRWSPDGRSIAFSAQPVSDAVGSGSEAAEVQEIYVLELATRKLLQVTADAAIDVTPAWSPDGKGLVIASNREKATRYEAGSLFSGFLDLWLVTIDASEDPILLTSDQGINAEADWYAGSSCGDVP
jgi:Tol biopolymer transport system component